MTALAYCTVTADLRVLTGSTSGDLTGVVTVECDAHQDGKEAILMLPTTNEVKVIADDPLPLVGSAVTFQVPRTGQVGVTVPDDFTYTVRFDVSNANGRKVKLPPLTFTAPGATLDLSDVSPVVPSAGTFVGVSQAVMAAYVQAHLGTCVPSQNTAPDPTKTQGWVDTSSSPAVLKTWNGAAWVAPSGGGATATTDADGIPVLVLS